MVSVGIPLDGIGFQCHFTLGQIPSDLQENLQRFADLGLDVAITEADINLRGPGNATAFAQQAVDYHSIVSACVAVERCVSFVRHLSGTLRTPLPVLMSCTRLFGGFQMTTVGFPTEKCCPGTHKRIRSRHSMPLLMRSRASKQYSSMSSFIAQVAGSFVTNSRIFWLPEP